MTVLRRTFKISTGGYHIFPRGKGQTDWGGVGGLLTQYIGEKRTRKVGIPVAVRPLGV